MVPLKVEGMSRPWPKPSRVRGRASANGERTPAKASTSTMAMPQQDAHWPAKARRASVVECSKRLTRKLPAIYDSGTAMMNQPTRDGPTP